MHISGSEDYGRDVEHVEILIQKFNLYYLTVLNQGESNIESIKSLCQVLESHPDREIIQKKTQKSIEMWEEFKELSQARKDALDGALKVHTFDRKADETIEWIEEKNNQEFVLTNIHSLILKNDIFINDVNAVQKQVDLLEIQAKELIQQFPDAIDHIQHKLNETNNAMNNLNLKTKNRTQILLDNNKQQQLFKEFTILCNFIKNTLAKINYELPPADSINSIDISCNINTLHSEIGLEIDKKINEFELFYIKNFKTQDLKHQFQFLIEKYQNVKTIVKNHLDLCYYLKDLDNFDKWINAREKEINYDNPNSVQQIELYIKKHDDFTKQIEHYENDKIQAIQRFTNIEDNIKMKINKDEQNFKRLKG